MGGVGVRVCSFAYYTVVYEELIKSSLRFSLFSKGRLLDFYYSIRRTKMTGRGDQVSEYLG